MGRYVMITDVTMSYDDLCTMEVGDVFYECDMGMIVKGTVVTNPVSTLVDDIHKLTFEAELEDIDIKSFKMTKREEPTSYLATKEYMHYGGKFYKNMYIWDRENQIEVDIGNVYV